MVTFQFHHYVKPEFIPAYRDAILEDARESIMEKGILRFEVFQDAGDPGHFILLEVYRDLSAREFHMQTPWLLKFRDAIRGQSMLIRAEGGEINLLFPGELTSQ